MYEMHRRERQETFILLSAQYSTKALHYALIAMDWGKNILKKEEHESLPRPSTDQFAAKLGTKIFCGLSIRRSRSSFNRAIYNFGPIQAPKTRRQRLRRDIFAETPDLGTELVEENRHRDKSKRNKGKRTRGPRHSKVMIHRSSEEREACSEPVGYYQKMSQMVLYLMVSYQDRTNVMAARAELAFMV